MRRRRLLFSTVSAVASAVLCAAPLFAGGARQAAEGESGSFLGLPVWIWKTANMVIFFGVLVWLLARPVTNYFRRRQEEIEENLKRAAREREEAARLSAEMHERLGRLETEVEEIKNRGRVDGEHEKAALIEQADRSVDRLRQEAEEEIERRLALAKADLARAGADIVAQVAREIVETSVTAEDRRRLLSEAIDRITEAR
jgi:F-type H+-transporting ATPase subunit b